MPYRLARARPDALFVGVDANVEGMLATAAKAARKPAKGGVDNLVLVHASVEALPDELVEIADVVTVMMPWAALLAAVLGENEAGLHGLARLAKPGAFVEAVFSCEARDRMAAISRDEILDVVAPRWRAFGLAIESIEAMPLDRVRLLPTTWAKRLAFGAPRVFWRVVARRLGPTACSAVACCSSAQPRSNGPR